jgi:hypothetical protein
VDKKCLKRKSLLLATAIISRTFFLNIGHIALLMAVSDDGHYIPPMVIYYKNIPRDLDPLPPN